jgi:hypothetical protein
MAIWWIIFVWLTWELFVDEIKVSLSKFLIHCPYDLVDPERDKNGVQRDTEKNVYAWYLLWFDVQVNKHQAHE